MKIIRNSLMIIFILLLSAYPVYAQDATPTTFVPYSTGTLEPLYKTPTVGPTKNVTCPLGTPVRWGTVTPFPGWEGLCRACEPTEQFATYEPFTPAPYTPAPWGTAGTPDPNGTPTPGGTSTPQIIGSPTPEYTLFTVNDLNFPYAFTWSYYNLDYYDLKDQYFLVKNPAVMNMYSVPVTVFVWGYLNNGWGANTHLLIQNLSDSAMTITSPEFGTVTIGANEVQDWEINEGGAFDNGTDHFIISGYTRLLHQSDDRVFKVWLHFWSGGFHDHSHHGSAEFGIPWMEPTPTSLPPTATPGYCECVNDCGGDIPEPDPFVPPIPRIGTPSCNQIGGLAIDMSWIQSIGNLLNSQWSVGSLIIPGVNICVTPLYLGHMSLMGIDIDLDTWLILMGGVVIIRMFTR